MKEGLGDFGFRRFYRSSNSMHVWGNLEIFSLEVGDKSISPCVSCMTSPKGGQL